MANKRINKLVQIKKKKSGRGSQGRVSVRHQGGAHKRYLRKLDWKRDKRDIEGKVIAFEYDPNRNADIALIAYIDGEKRYILAPTGLKIGSKVISSTKASVKPGNAMPLSKVPVGLFVHNLEIVPGKGGQMIRGAGTGAIVQSKDKKKIKVKLPSGEVRLFSADCWVTVGKVGNPDYKYRKLRKAGDKRRRGIRPTVRGVAQHPGSHPHGGGEGRSPIGMPSPKTPWGKKTLGKRTRKRRKYSNKLIIKRRK